MFRTGFFRDHFAELGLLLLALIPVGILVYGYAVAPGTTTRNAIRVGSFQDVQEHPDQYNGRWVELVGSLRYIGSSSIGRMETAMDLYDSTGALIPNWGVYVGGILPAGTILPARIFLRIDDRRITNRVYALIPPE